MVVPFICERFWCPPNDLIHLKIQKAPLDLAYLATSSNTLEMILVCFIAKALSIWVNGSANSKAAGYR